MKKQILAALLTLATATISFAEPMMIGDVTLKDHLIILNKNIVCTAYGAPTFDGTKPTSTSDLFFGTFTVGMAQPDGSILVNGDLGGDSIQVIGNANESLNISLSARAEAGKLPVYSFSSSGKFSDQVIHGKRIQSADLTVMLSGKTKTVSCSIE